MTDTKATTKENNEVLQADKLGIHKRICKFQKTTRVIAKGTGNSYLNTKYASL
jgi:hypothetical protein